MKTIKELKRKLNSQLPFADKYTIDLKDNKVHLLYVSPQFSATGFYRMIAPALELNKTSTHKALITNIEVNNFSRKLSDFANQLDERLITWADYIIFPSLFTNVSYLIQAIKTINPQVQLIMDVDRNYFALPTSIPLSRKLTKEKLKHFETNLGLIDLITVANKQLQKFLQKLVADRLSKSTILVLYLPSLVSQFSYEEMPPLKSSNQNPIRVGLIKPSEEDLLSLKEVVLQINTSSLREDIQWVCLGKPHSSEEADLLLKEIDCEIHNTVSFLNYFEKLNDLQLGLVLLPAKEALYNRHRNIQLFLELSVFGIPAVTSIHNPISKFITDSKNGFIAEGFPEWVEIITAFKNSDTSYKARLSSFITKDIWKNYSFSQINLDTLKENLI